MGGMFREHLYNSYNVAMYLLGNFPYELTEFKSVFNLKLLKITNIRKFLYQEMKQPNKLLTDALSEEIWNTLNEVRAVEASIETPLEKVFSGINEIEGYVDLIDVTLDVVEVNLYEAENAMKEYPNLAEQEKAGKRVLALQKKIINLRQGLEKLENIIGEEDKE